MDGIFHKSMEILLITCFLASVMSTSFIVKNEGFEAYDQNIPGSGLIIKLIPIQGGHYLAGSPSNERNGQPDERPLHKVEIIDFWMSSLEISWDLFELFLYREIDQTPRSSNKDDIELKVDGVSAATMPYVNYNKPGHPAVNITQYAASTFCKWLTAKTGNFYRLPTEAEWEYACRAGSTFTYSFGNDISTLDDFAWYQSNSNDTFHPGGLKKPNTWNLYDMHGNVAEWVIDQYDPEFYSSAAVSQKNPVLFSKTLYPRVVRGGSWLDGPEKLRSAARDFSTKKWKRRDPQFPKSLWWMTDATHVGFRIVRPKKSISLAEMNVFWGEPIEEY